MHDHHDHGDERGANARRLGIVLVLSAVYMVAEVVGGLWSGSLALLADAGHMLSDVVSLGLALFAIWIAQKPRDSRRTYGHTRAEILAALAQGVALVLVAIFVVTEAISRISEPSPVQGLGMLGIAAGGLAVNLLGLAILARGRRDNLNLRGAFLHVLSDALGSVGAIVAGFVIWQYGWLWADPAVSLCICVLVLAGAWHLLREAVDVLMETAPRHLDVDDIRAALSRLPAVGEVHDLHVWTIGNGEVSLSSHVVAVGGSEPGELLASIHAELASRFGIAHATIQIESEGTGAADDEGCATGCAPAPLAAVGD